MPTPSLVVVKELYIKVELVMRSTAWILQGKLNTANIVFSNWASFLLLVKLWLPAVCNPAVWISDIRLWQDVFAAGPIHCSDCRPIWVSLSKNVYGSMSHSITYHSVFIINICSFPKYVQTKLHRTSKMVLYMVCVPDMVNKNIDYTKKISCLKISINLRKMFPSDPISTVKCHNCRLWEMRSLHATYFIPTVHACKQQALNMHAFCVCFGSHSQWQKHKMHNQCKMRPCPGVHLVCS